MELCNRRGGVKIGVASLSPSMECSTIYSWGLRSGLPLAPYKACGGAMALDDDH